MLAYATTACCLVSVKAQVCMGFYCLHDRCKSCLPFVTYAIAVLPVGAVLGLTGAVLVLQETSIC